MGFKKTISGAAFLLVFICAGAPLLRAQDAPEAFRTTGYPLPRFVSLAADEVHVRTGPGQRYPILWVFRKAGLPVEIVLEYDNWRKIRDHEGETGWVHSSLLSGKRSALIMAGEPVPLYRKPGGEARQTARAENLAVVTLKACEAAWCKVEAQGYRGWAERKFLWGVYENEIFD